MATGSGCTSAAETAIPTVQPPSVLESRVVTLHLTVLSENDEPIPDVPLSLRMSLEASTKLLKAGTITDPDGRATMACIVPATLDSIAVGLGAFVGDHPRAAQLTGGVSGQLFTLEETWAFARTYRIALTPQESDYSLTIRVKPAVVISGRMLVGAPPAPQQLGLAVIEDYYGSSQLLRVDGKFKLRGVPSSTPSKIWISHGTVAKLVDVPAQESDTNIGDVIIDKLTTGPVVRCTMLSRLEDGEEVPPGSGVSFVRSDGLAAYQFRLQSTMFDYHGTEPNLLVGDTSETLDYAVRVPAGTYYVVPNFWILSESQVAFVNALRLGQVPMEGTVPKIVMRDMDVVCSIDYWRMLDDYLEFVKPRVPRLPTTH